jgi:hypothetical protein
MQASDEIIESVVDELDAISERKLQRKRERMRQRVAAEVERRVRDNSFKRWHCEMTTFALCYAAFVVATSLELLGSAETLLVRVVQFGTAFVFLVAVLCAVDFRM